MFEEDYKSIFIGTGVWNPKTLNIKGETLGDAHFAIDKMQDVFKCESIISLWK